MSKTLDIVGHTGVPMFARLVEAGDRYGRDGCLVCEGEPMVEFYDARYDFEKWLGRPGQIISRYYLSTLQEGESHLSGGLCLDGGTDDWAISGETLEEVVIWAGDDLADLSRRVGRIFDDMKADALKRLPACTSTLAQHKEQRQNAPFAIPKKYVVAYCEWGQGQYSARADKRYRIVEDTLREIRSAGL